MSCLLASCGTPPREEVIIYRDTLVTPPARFLEHCRVPVTSRTVEAELERRGQIIDCERADKDALRAWSDEATREQE